jgi:hypothetical protein
MRVLILRRPLPASSWNFSTAAGWTIDSMTRPGRFGVVSDSASVAYRRRDERTNRSRRRLFPGTDDGHWLRLAETHTIMKGSSRDRGSTGRYVAACSAALAGSGQGADAPADQAGRAALRGHALAWLRVQLAARAKQAVSDNPADRQIAAFGLKAWLEEGVLAAVRPRNSKCDLPANERPGWESFWADVRATIEAAQKPVPPAPTIQKP